MRAIPCTFLVSCLTSIKLGNGHIAGHSHGGHHHDHDTTPHTPPVDPVDNMAYLFTQGNKCLDADQNANTLILYDCHGYYQANQEFIWRIDPGMTSHFVFTTALGGSCLTIDGVSGQEPETSAPANFQPCNPNNTNSLWDYNFYHKRLTLTNYPHLCLDYHSEWNSHFAIYPCQHHQISFFGSDTQYNEIVNVEIFNFNYDTTPRGPLVPAPQANGTYLMTFGDYCMDFHVDGDQIVLYTCNLELNQEFQWRSAANGAFTIFTAMQGGKCLSIDGGATAKPANGAKITFRPCSEADASQLWTYDSTRRMLHSGTWDDLCADFMDAGMMSSDHYIVYTCKGPSEDPANQNVNIEVIPQQYAPFVVANYALPSQVPTPRIGMSLLGMSGMAAIFSFVFVTGLVFVARRSRRGVSTGDVTEDSLDMRSPLD